MTSSLLHFIHDVGKPGGIPVAIFVECVKGSFELLEDLKCDVPNVHKCLAGFVAAASGSDKEACKVLLDAPKATDHAHGVLIWNGVVTHSSPFTHSPLLVTTTSPFNVTVTFETSPSRHPL